MSEPADLLITGGRLFVAYRPTDLVPFGTDIGPRPVGADADLVVLDRDILAGGPSSIIGTTVAMTVVGGKIVHRSEALP